jgi:hypothetical protein
MFLNITEYSASTSVSLTILIPPTAHTHHYPSSGTRTIGPIVADLLSTLILTAPQETKKC